MPGVLTIHYSEVGDGFTYVSRPLGRVLVAVTTEPHLPHSPSQKPLSSVAHVNVLHRNGVCLQGRAGNHLAGHLPISYKEEVFPKRMR